MIGLGLTKVAAKTSGHKNYIKNEILSLFCQMYIYITFRPIWLENNETEDN